MTEAEIREIKAQAVEEFVRDVGDLARMGEGYALALRLDDVTGYVEGLRAAPSAKLVEYAPSYIESRN